MCAAAQHFNLAGFELESGEVLAEGASVDRPAPSLAYKVHGLPEGEAIASCGKRVVLLPTSFDATHVDLEYIIGAGNQHILDTTDSVVIVVNQLGNGVSFSPSQQLRAAVGGGLERATADPIYRFSIGDDVRAQKLMLERALGVTHLDVAYGYSMGAMQALDWASRYPTCVGHVVAVCGASRCGDLNRVFLDSLEAALCADPAYDAAGDYFTELPHRGLEAFSRIYSGWGVGASFYLHKHFREAGWASGADFVQGDYLPAFAGGDPNDLLSQVRTWKGTTALGATERDCTGAEEADEATAEALGRVQARVLYMPCDTDKYFTLTEAAREVSWLGGERDRVRLRPISSAFGHRAGDPRRESMAGIYDYIREEVRNFVLDDPSA